MLYAIALGYCIVGFVLQIGFLTQYPAFFRSTLYYSIIIAIFGVVACYYFGWRHPSHWISSVVLVAIGYYMVDQSLEFYFDNLDGLLAFWPITLLQWHLLLFYVVGGLSAFVIQCGRALHGFLKVRKIRPWQIVREIQAHPKQEAVLLGILVVTGVFVGLVETQVLTPTATIEITPKDYQIDLAFWAKLDPDTYTTTEKDALNRHSTLLIFYDVYEWFEDGEESQLNFINWTTIWRDQYPNVRIMPVVHGIPGRFLWDGCAQTSIRFAHRILRTTVENNLTNVIGLNTDQEKPHDVLDEDKLKSRTRNELAAALWEKFFAEVEKMYPGRFEFQTTFSMNSIVDTFDGDRDLDVYVWNHVLNNPSYDEFAPMVYMKGGGKTIDGVLDAGPHHFTLYREMKVLYDALSLQGLESRIGVYIGITGEKIFTAEKPHLFNGVEGKGFDALVTQGLIAKHFRCPRLTIFILNSEGDGHGGTMWGVFDAYGEDFLDRYNLSINGVAASTPFTLPFASTTINFEEIQLDVWLNWYMPIVYGSIVASGMVSQIIPSRRIRRIASQRSLG